MSSQGPEGGKCKVLVIGAGPAGMSAAYRLSQLGHPVEVFEAAGEVGGLARSFDLWGQKVDVGPHRFFTKNRQVNELFDEVVGKEQETVERKTRIFYQGRFFNYPLRLGNIFRNLPPSVMIHCGLSYVWVRLFPPRDLSTFEGWVVHRFGRRLFDIFFRSYTEKVWGIPCSRLDSDWASQRIRKLSLYQAVKAAIFPDHGRAHKSLVDSFAYPIEGTGMIYQRMAQRIEEAGGKIHLKTPVKRILQDADGRVRGLALADGGEVEGSEVVSSMPITLLVKGFDEVPDPVQEAVDQLYYRQTILVYLRVNQGKLFPDNWVYVHDDSVRHGRVTNFSNWPPGWRNRPEEQSILCLEYWCFPEDEIWKETDEALGRLAETELKQTRLLPTEAEVTDYFVLRVPRSYPVYEKGYLEPLSKIQAFLDGIPGLKAIGRYGSFKYNNQDHSLLMGLLAAHEIDTGERLNLWEVNTEEDYHEEATAS